MNTPTITRAKLYTRLVFLGVMLCGAKARGEWTVDLSRRLPPARLDQSRGPASSAEFPLDASTEFGSSTVPYPSTPVVNAPAAPVNAGADDGFLSSIFRSNDVAQEIVVLNTEKGFVPSTVHVKQGLNYRIDVVNVNEKERNVSFVLDSFSEHHGTYYGKIKSFVIRPQKEGVYKFISPETSAQGKLVVSPAPAVQNRLPASAN